MPDPEKALKNLERLVEESPWLIEGHEQDLDGIARLFSHSQFLADYSIKNPNSLSLALKQIDSAANRRSIASEARGAFRIHAGEPVGSLKKKAMEFIRDVKKHHLLRITLRDLLGITGLKECMAELSVLAEAAIETALEIAEFIVRERFGFMRDNAFAVLGLGKLGAGELNYSSDIDILTVYRFENRLSTGVLTPYGIRTNRIEAHEYYCRLTETLTNLLQSPTEDGIVYRVDLRLRPNGQKGPISLSLDSYRSYYEAWGKTWERIALIRSRPVAGDNKLGEAFMYTVEPFVWKRSVDYHDIEEIRELKKKIDAISDANDIKRGYGGIREIEFFAQTFQLLYGGEKKVLRAGTIAEVLEILREEGLLAEKDVKTLSECYLFLRRIEHILQMKDDIQTYTLPSDPDELEALSKKMRFSGTPEFLSDLRLKRLKVRDMYYSLLGGADETPDILLSLKDELPDDSVLDYLSFKGFKDTGSALRNINGLTDQLSAGKTIRERTVLRKTIPAFLEQIVKSANKDRALGMLVEFFRKVGNHESYVDLLRQRDDTREIIVRVFSQSSYLSRLLLGLDNLEGIFEYPDIRTNYRAIRERLMNLLDSSADPLNAVREFKMIQELKSGMLFLKGYTDAYVFSRTLSMLADVAIRALVHYLRSGKGFAVIGLGGFGARDLNIGSDLDLLFAGSRESSSLPGGRGHAEELIRFLSEYTSKGVAYKVDMRLRPDGTRGVLVKDIESYENYYLKSAQPWEIQSLLRARPIAGDMNLLRAFQQMKRRAMMQRGVEIKGRDMRDMRKRIVREVSRESSGYDLKAGPGGIKEIEFLTQYLQLKHVGRFPRLITFDTVSAIRKLAEYGILDGVSEELFLGSHRFLKSVDTLLRLNEEDVLKTDSELLDIIVVYLKLGSSSELIQKIENARRKVAETAESFYM